MTVGTAPDRRADRREMTGLSKMVAGRLRKLKKSRKMLGNYAIGGSVSSLNHAAADTDKP
jgi:hypothetical protein